MQNVNELTISLIAGLITGVQVRGPDGVARGLKLGDLGGALDGVNEAALLSNDALKREIADRDAAHESLKADYADFKARGAQAAEAARAIIADTRINDAETCARVDAIAAAMLKDKKARDLEAAVKAAQAAVDLVDRLRNDWY